MKAFSWPALPKSSSEFEAMMLAIDSLLTEQGLTPFQRPIHVGRKLWEAFGWGGRMFPESRIADLPGYEGDVLIAKANRWYEHTYGDQLKGDFAYGFAPFRLGNNVWRVRVAQIFGTVNFFLDRNLQNKGKNLAVGAHAGGASTNVLNSVEGLTQGIANNLSEAALSEFMEFYFLMHEALQWRFDSLPKTELLSMAYHDYDECTSAVLGRRYGQARWSAQQALEKTFKGLLSIGKTAFPTGGKNGHSLAYSAQLLKDNHGISLNSGIVALAECSPAVRYGEIPSSEGQALTANHAVLAVLYQLSQSNSVQALLQKHIG